MTDRQAAEAREAGKEMVAAMLRAGVPATTAMPLAARASAAVDALSVRLAQECALRAQAEQEASLLRRERDEARAEAELANAACSGENGRFYRKWARTQERLRVADALKREYEEALRIIAEADEMAEANEGAFAVHAFRRVQATARFVLAASGGREAPDTKEPT